MADQQISRGLQTSVKDLKTLLAKSGFDVSSPKLQGLEKLDLIKHLVDTIQEQITIKHKMILTLGDLNSFLRTEGMEIKVEEDFMYTIEQMMALRIREIKRLAYANGAGHDESFALQTQQEEDDEFTKLMKSRSQLELAACFNVRAVLADQEPLQRKRRREDEINTCRSKRDEAQAYHEEAQMQVKKLKENLDAEHDYMQKQDMQRVQEELARRKQEAEQWALNEQKRIEADKKLKMQDAYAWAEVESGNIDSKLAQVKRQHSTRIAEEEQNEQDASQRLESAEGNLSKVLAGA